MKQGWKHTFKFITVIVSVVFVHSCAVGPKYETPVVTAPDKFLLSDSVAQGDSLDLKWWELFSDPILDSMVKIALVNNKDIRIAASRIEQSRAKLGYSRADNYPVLGYSAGAATGNYTGGLLKFNEDQRVFYGNAQLAWELDFWGKFRRSNESAKAEMMAFEYNMRAMQIALISEVVTSYFLLLDMQTRLDISNKTLTSRDSGLKIIQARFEYGIVPEIDVNQAQIQKSLAEASVPYYERQIVQMNNALSVLLGENPKVIDVHSTLFEHNLPPQIPVGLPSELLSRRPDIMESSEKLHAQNANIGVAQAYRFPTISLTGLLGSVSNDLSTFGTGDLAWSAGAGIAGPIFQFNKNKRRVEMEREKTNQLLYTYEKNVINAFSEVENAITSISTLKKELSARSDQRRAALSSEMLSFQRYNKGVTSYLEVLENQRAAFEAELIYSQTYQQLLNAYVLLYKVLGGGWLSEEERAQANPPAE